MIGDFLYALTQRDLQSWPHQFRHDNASTTSAGSYLVLDMDVPDERLWVIESIAIAVDAGQGSGPVNRNVIEIELSICDQQSGGGVCRTYHRERFAAARTKEVNLHGLGLILSQPRSLELYAVFDGAGDLTAHFAEFAVVGFDLPRGNFVP